MVKVRFLRDWAHYRYGAVGELTPKLAEFVCSIGHAVALEPPATHDAGGQTADTPLPPDEPAKARKRGRPPKTQPDDPNGRQ